MPCPVGTYNPTEGGSDASVCLSCPPGYSTDFPGTGDRTLCRACPAGSYGSGGMPCLQCPAGTASSALGAGSSSTCQACGAGAVASQPGSSECSPCPAGTVASYNHTACVQGSGGSSGSGASGSGSGSGLDSGKSGAPSAPLSEDLSDWNHVKYYLLPILSLVAYYLGYVTVGDTLHAYCMPVCYARCWRGVANALARPPPSLCCSCYGSLALAAASRILKRVQDVEEDCARTRGALEALRAKQVQEGLPGEAPTAPGDSSSSSSSSSTSRDSLSVTSNPLKRAQEAGKA